MFARLIELIELIELKEHVTDAQCFIGVMSDMQCRDTTFANDLRQFISEPLT